MSRRGRALQATSNDDRCEALTVMTDWKVRNKREQRCPFMAKYLVQGHQFCMHHARVEAVAICAEKGLLTRLARPVPVFGARAIVMQKEKNK